MNGHLTTISGIDPILAAAILSEIGDISFFSSGVQLVAFAAIDPSVKQSGEFIGNRNHRSKRGTTDQTYEDNLAQEVYYQHKAFK